jgi:ubiquinone/menaquinone biosynthesis C-methylase UbiE
MTSPFDELASSYATVWSDTSEGRGQRQQVWREIDPLFQPGDRVLDLGCGIGDDAVHLAGRAVEVYGIDASARMIQTARSRGVEAMQLNIGELAQLRGAFSGAISNFGALNCIADLTGVARDLARLLKPGAPLAVCVMGRFWLSETVRFVLARDWRAVVRRWSGRAVWRGVEVHYWSAGAIRRSFTPYFRIEKRVAVGGGDHQLYILRQTLV